MLKIEFDENNMKFLGKKKTRIHTVSSSTFKAVIFFVLFEERAKVLGLKFSLGGQNCALHCYHRWTKFVAALKCEQIRELLTIDHV